MIINNIPLNSPVTTDCGEQQQSNDRANEVGINSGSTLTSPVEKGNLKRNQQVKIEIGKVMNFDEKSQPRKKSIMKIQKQNKPKSVQFQDQESTPKSKSEQEIGREKRKALRKQFSKKSQSQMFVQQRGSSLSMIKSNRAVKSHENMDCESEFLNSENLSHSKKSSQQELFIDNLLETNKQSATVKRPFQLAEYHQCIPNPAKSGSFITVQLAKIQLQQYDQDKPLEDLDESEEIDGVSKSTEGRFEAPETFSMYEFKEIENDQSANSIRGSQSLRTVKSRAVTSKDDKNSMNWKKVQEHAEFTAYTKCGQIIQNKTQMPDDISQMLKEGTEIAIIGFWEKDKDKNSNQLKCKNHTFVPNPLKRPLCNSSPKGNEDKDIRNKKIIYQFLFTSQSNDELKSDVFFFYKDQEGEIRFALLDCAINQKRRLSILKEPKSINLKDFIKAETVISDIETSMTIDQMFKSIGTSHQWAKQSHQNPILYRNFMKTEIQTALPKIMSFKQTSNTSNTSNLSPDKRRKTMKKNTSQQSEQVRRNKSLNITEELTISLPIKNGGIRFYNLKNNSITKEIQDAIAIVSYQQDTVESCFGTLTYLGGRDSKGKQKIQNPQYFVNLSLDEKLQQESSKDIQQRIEYDTITADSQQQRLKNKTLIIDTYSHCRGNRLTFIIANCLSFTFVIEKEKELILVRYFEEDNIKAVYYNNLLFLQTGVKNLQIDSTKSDKFTGYAAGELNFHDISDEQIDFEVMSSHTKDHRGLQPQKEYSASIMLASKFKRCYESQGEYLYWIMPTTVDKETVIHGSVICEDPINGELNLNFFTSQIDKGQSQQIIDDKSLIYPQKPMQQKYIVEFPLLAYKTMTPDNKQISIVHLNQEIPQRLVNLGKYEFIAFVQNDFNTHSCATTIMLLVRDTEAQMSPNEPQPIKLIMIAIDSWKRIDRSKPFNEPEQVYEFVGTVAQPPPDKLKQRLYSQDKIKEVQLIVNEQTEETNSQLKMMTLVIQYEHCITTASVKGEHFSELCPPKKMVKEFMIRGGGQKVYFAQKNDLNSYSIMRISYHKKFKKKIVIETVFEFNQRIVALECDQDALLLDTKNKNTKECFYALQDNGRLFKMMIPQDPLKTQFDLVNTYDYSDHNLIDVIDDDWSRVFIDDKVIIYKTKIYPITSEHVEGRYKPKTFFLNTNDDSGDKTQMKYSTVVNVNKISASLALGKTQNEANYFEIMQSASSRKIQLVPSDQSDHILTKCFVSSYHVLLQFKSDMVPIKDQFRMVDIDDRENRTKGKTNQPVIINTISGQIVTQEERINYLLGRPIVGESDLYKGKKYIIVDDASTLTCIKFEKETGIGNIKWEIQDYQKQFRLFCNQRKPISDQDKEELQLLLAKYLTEETYKERKKNQPILKAVSHQPQSQPYFNKFAKLQKTKSQFISELLDDEQRAEQSFKFSNQIFVNKKGDIVLTCDYLPIEKLFLSVIDQDSGETGKFGRDANDTSLQIEVLEKNKFDFSDSKDVKISVVLVTNPADKITQDQVSKNIENNQIIENQKRKYFLNKFKWRMVGPYFCYQYLGCENGDSKKIKIKKIFFENTEERPDLAIDLDKFEKQGFNLRKVWFVNLPEHQYFFKKNNGDKATPEFYENLMQLTIESCQFIFDLDSNPFGKYTPNEVMFYKNTDLLMNQEKFINIGIEAQRFDNSQEKKIAKESYKMNESVSLYFKEVIQEVKQNASNSYIISEDNFWVKKVRRRIYSGYIFRTHSYLNLLDLKWILEQQHNSDKDELNIMRETILSTYEGHTIFSMFMDKPDVFEQINKQYNDGKLIEEINPAVQEDDAQLSLLLAILDMPVLNSVTPRSEDPNYNCDECIKYMKQRKQTLSKQLCPSKPLYCDCKSFSSICKKSVHFSSTKHRDILIKLALTCDDACLTTFVDSIDDLEILIQRFNPIVEELFDRTLIETQFTEGIQTVDWRNDFKKLLLRSYFSFVSEDDINELVIEQETPQTKSRTWKQILVNMLKLKCRVSKDSIARSVVCIKKFKRKIFQSKETKQLVECRLLRTDWIFKKTATMDDNDLFNLINTLNTQATDSLFGTEFITILIEEFWELYQMAIFLVVFIPFMIYAVACLLYFTLHQKRVEKLFSDEEMDLPQSTEQVSRMVVYALSFYMLSFEILQIYDFGWSYLSSFTNWVDQVSTWFILLLLLKNDFFPERLYSIGYESVVTTIAISLTFYKMFYFMKLFESTAFFINLIASTFVDKNFRAFAIITGFLLLTFSNILYVLNTERGDDLKYAKDSAFHNDNIYAAEISDQSFVNAVIYSFKLSLGDFSTSGFKGNNQGSTWIVFVFATFLLQITFLNMIIAIMANTFDYVMEKKQQTSMKERISILADFRFVLRALRLEQEFPYILVVKPKVENNEDEWQGMLDQIKKQFKTSTEMILKSNEKTAKRHDTQMNQIKDQIKNMKVSNSTIQSSIKDQTKLFKEMMARLQQIEEKVDKKNYPEIEEQLEEEQSDDSSRQDVTSEYSEENQESEGLDEVDDLSLPKPKIMIGSRSEWDTNPVSKFGDDS